MIIRKASANDIDAVESLYDAIHTAEESGKQTIGWVRAVYPVRATAEAALERGDLFVLEDAGRICGAGIINSTQVECYKLGKWKYDAPGNRVCVLHTLVISPDSSGRGYGKAFLAYYEKYAMENGFSELRIDTNAKNTVARSMYKKLGYTEAGIVPTDFNGIAEIELVLLEKHIGTVELRRASVSDCAFIASLFDNDEYQLYFAENGTTPDEWRERFDYFEKGGNFIIYDGAVPAGWLTYSVEGDTCDIGIIVIRHELVGSGIGYRAFDKACSSLPAGVKFIKLDVQQRNEHAVAFYKRYGFKITGEEKQPVGDGEQWYFNMTLRR